MNFELPANAPVRRRPSRPRSVPWWTAVAERHAASYRPAPDFPAFYLAARVAETLTHDQAEGHCGMVFGPHESGPNTWVSDLPMEYEELVAAVFVVGYLAQHPGAARLDDRTLTGLALGWAYGLPADWPWFADEVTAAASTERRPGVATWAAWWRAAAIWPQAVDIELFASDLEFLWQQRTGLRVRDASGATHRLRATMFDERGWVLADRDDVELPVLALAQVFAAVFGPEPTHWPRPYDTWLPGLGSTGEKARPGVPSA